MFINEGARGLLLAGEREKFLAEEWPRVQATIQRLGLKTQDLLNGDASRSSSTAKTEITARETDSKKER
jgi:GntR family transcriptional regulator